MLEAMFRSRETWRGDRVTGADSTEPKGAANSVAESGLYELTSN